ncbi:hypothetical protein CVT25_003327 [Psilocybe cyanescens]|uniref:Uncharacterized protein n=1 Tax=Psilocybe cyanescens TaxID=93625 RepID=A0A409X094_PSICY|nr:hypothetical protein CVT25_003327 [Psilocybe cyanescens]
MALATSHKLFSQRSLSLWIFLIPHNSKNSKHAISVRGNLLGALVGPLRSKEYLRISCDLLNFYFAFDEYTDLAN